MFSSLRKLSRLERILVVVVALMFAISIASVTFVFLEGRSDESSFDPFGDYPIQTVINADRSEDGYPVISLSEDSGVQVVGKKCIDYDRPVEVSGYANWVVKTPSGAEVEHFSGSGILQPGCTFFVENPETDCPIGTYVSQSGTPGTCRQAFFNDFTTNEELHQLLDGYHERGINPRLELQGFETPVEGGVTQTWRTEQFVVVP